MEDPSWTPLLSGNLAARARAAIDDITAALRDVAPADDNKRGDVGSGAPGFALYHSYLDAANTPAGEEPDPDAEPTAAATIAAAQVDSAVRAAAEVPMSLALYGGYTGVGWLVAHLCDDESADEVGGRIDEALLAALKDEKWTRDYDLISGLVGYGVYALERSDAAGRAVLTRLLDHFELSATPHPTGRAWYTAPELLPEWQRQLCPDGYYNLGLAHGIPGIIGLLARMVARDIEASRARPLLEDAVGWLLDSSDQREEGRFAAWLGRGAGTEPARLAWCYGDPGVAIELYAAARAMERDDWETEALTCARVMARRSVEKSGVRDSGLCHGSSGLAHIYNRFYQTTGDPIFGDAARSWFTHLLDNRRPEGYAGFPAWEIPEGTSGQYRAEPGFLTGAAGVGLALIAATSETEPLWDRLLMTDL